MSQIKSISLQNNQKLLIEVIDTELPVESLPTNTISDLPEGAEPVGVIDDVLDSMEILREQVSNIASSIKEAFNENMPNEFSVEMGIGFAGEGAIPFIASAKSNANLKIKATWKKGD